MNTNCWKRLAWITAAALLSAATTAGAIGVAETPLFISTGATPNVMLLVDNSGSMDNVIWDDGFNPATAYPDWSPEICGNNNNQECWTPDNGNVLLGQMPGCSGSNFNNDVKGGIRNGVFRCIRLPDAAGSNSTRYSGNYLNYLFETYGQDSVNFVDIRGQIPNSLRIQVARNVASNIVSSNSNLRIGLSSFNTPVSGEGAPGGRINADCGTATSTLLTRIGNLSSEANTPLAETFYEITRYFRGLTGYFNGNPSYTSPIQYRCQKNFVVVVTDGFPTWDTQFPTNDPDDPAGAPSLPDWDGLAPATQEGDYPNFPQYSDGFAPNAAAAQGEGRTLFLDDLAKFGHDLDLRKTGNDSAGVSFNDPPFEQQNLITYTVGFAIQNQMLQDAASSTYGDGIYLTASNEAQLSSALQTAFRDILARTTAAASVATNSTRLTGDTFIYQARFSTADWSGQLLAFEIDEDDGSVGASPAWDAADDIPSPGTRRLFSYDPTAAAGSRGIEFEWAELNSSQQTALNTNAGGTNDGLGQQRLGYLRGERGNEAPNGSQFRARSTVLGDIINSDPFFVGKQDFGFDRLPEGGSGVYASFREQKASRPGMIYVGANDGKLEAINATSGAEVFAYVPNAVFSKLSQLTAANYNQNHRYLVDGSPRALDAYINNTWKTVLLGSLGAGGRGVFALDVTDPQNFGTDDVMWEFTSSQDGDMGLSIPQPSIARMYNGKWAAIVANGYNSASGRAMLFIIDLETGSVLKKIDTGVGSDNGLSTPIPVDVDSDRIVDFIYAGDLKGNLWKFDVTASNANQWDVAFKSGSTPLSLFTACATTGSCTSGDRQPITARPEVSLNPTGGFVVHFGTGRYFATGDATLTSPINSFYGIFDRNEKGASSPARVGDGRSNLRQQSVVATTTVSGQPVRVTSNTPLTDADKGWFIDLPETGERQVSTPLLRGGRLIFSTLTPNTDPCGFGGTSWLMELDAASGSRLSVSPFDLNDDRQFNSGDFATLADGTRVPVSGRQITQGIIKTPGVVEDPASGIEHKYASTTAGTIDYTRENAGDASGRQSWRQLQ
jgi:type IV pilus assembly protein PilY1